MRLGRSMLKVSTAAPGHHPRSLPTEVGRFGKVGIHEEEMRLTPREARVGAAGAGCAPPVAKSVTGG